MQHNPKERVSRGVDRSCPVNTLFKLFYAKRGVMVLRSEPRRLESAEMSAVGCGEGGCLLAVSDKVYFLGRVPFYDGRDYLFIRSSSAANLLWWLMTRGTSLAKGGGAFGASCTTDRKSLIFSRNSSSFRISPAAELERKQLQPGLRNFRKFCVAIYACFILNFKPIFPFYLISQWGKEDKLGGCVNCVTRLQIYQQKDFFFRPQQVTSLR